MSCPHSRSRGQHSDEWYPREGRWTVNPGEGKDSGSNGSR